MASTPATGTTREAHQRGTRALTVDARLLLPHILAADEQAGREVVAAPHLAQLVKDLLGWHGGNERRVRAAKGGGGRRAQHLVRGRQP